MQSSAKLRCPISESSSCVQLQLPLFNDSTHFELVSLGGLDMSGCVLGRGLAVSNREQAKIKKMLYDAQVLANKVPEERAEPKCHRWTVQEFSHAASERS